MVEFKMPEKLGACADLLHKLRAQKAKEAKKVAAIDEKIKAVKKHLIEKLEEQGADGVAGRSAKVGIVTKVVGSVKDWERFWKYLHRTKHHHLMQRRVSNTALREMWADGKKIPGVERFPITDLSCTKKR
jgi:hypothetical protein